MALDFAAGTETAVPNSGSSKAKVPDAQALAVQRSHDVPAGASGQSMDFGSDVTTRSDVSDDRNEDAHGAEQQAREDREHMDRSGPGANCPGLEAAEMVSTRCENIEHLTHTMPRRH